MEVWWWLVLWSTVVGYLVYKFLTWNYDYWQRRGVPYLPGRPPFGNIADIFFHKKIIGQLYEEIYRKFEGSPWCGFFKLRTPILMIRDPELVKTVLIKQFNNFSENDFHFNPRADPIFAMNPFTATGQRWKEMRGVLAPTQTPARVKTVIPCTVQVANNMLQYLDRNTGNNINLLDFFGHFTTDVTARWGLGLETNSFEQPDTELRTKATNMFGGDFKSNTAIVLGFYAPSLGNLLGWSMLRDQFADYFTKVVVDVLDSRQRKTDTDTETDSSSRSGNRQDFVDLLLDLARNSLANNKRVIDFEEVTGHALTFFSEGYLTSTFTLTFIFHELSRHQQVQERARQELRDVTDGRPLHSLDYDQLQRLVYLQQVIDEALRLYPTVPMMTRVCTGRTVLTSSQGATLTVEPGTPVTIPVMGLHRDPVHYPDPLRFDPDRFSEVERAARDRILYLGFSDGPRACVGLRFALTNLKICLAAVLLHYRILPAAGTPNFTIDTSSSFVMTPKNAYVKFEKL